jgi:hypothetical protein
MLSLRGVRLGSQMTYAAPASVKWDRHLKVFRVVRVVKDQSLMALNTSHFTDAGVHSEVQCQESMRFKNSDLRSKCPNGTSYILQVAKQILQVPILGKPQMLLVLVLVLSQSMNTTTRCSSMSHKDNQYES